MVLVWGYLARGNDGLTLVLVALNSLTMLVLYGVLGGFLLGVGRLPVPWQALVLSIGVIRRCRRPVGEDTEDAHLPRQHVNGG